MEGAGLHGLHGRLDGAEGGEDDDLDLGVQLADLLHDLQPVHAGHADIGEDQIRPFLLEQLQPLLAARRREDGIAFLGEIVFQDAPQALVVVDDQDLDPLHDWRLPSSGRVIAKVVPFPGWLTTRMAPRWFSMIR